jgi:hypothetical protein
MIQIQCELFGRNLNILIAFFWYVEGITNLYTVTLLSSLSCLRSPVFLLGPVRCCRPYARSIPEKAEHLVQTEASHIIASYNLASIEVDKAVSEWF